MLWKIQEICSKMGINVFEIDEEVSEIIDAKVGNPQNSTSIKSANLSQPWNVEFFQDYIFKKYVHFQSQRVPKGKIAHIWQLKEQKNNKITPKNVSQKGFQSLPDVLQHPVYAVMVQQEHLLLRTKDRPWLSDCRSQWVNTTLAHIGSIVDYSGAHPPSHGNTPQNINNTINYL